MGRDDVVATMIAQWRRERPDLDPEPMALFGRLSRADALANRGIAAGLADAGLNRGEFDVLATLRRSGAPFELSAGALSAALLLSPGAMTNRLDRLEGLGLVQRRRDAEDARTVVVALTDAGVERIEAAVTAHVANMDRMLEGLTAGEQAQLSRLLDRLLRCLEGP